MNAIVDVTEPNATSLQLPGETASLIKDLSQKTHSSHINALSKP